MGILTSANFDWILVRRTAKQLLYAGLDSTTVDGTNIDLADGKVEGLRSLGLVPLSSLNLVDQDLLAVTDGMQPQLIDVAELLVLEHVLGNRASPDQEAGTDNYQYHGKFFDSLEKRIDRKRKNCERRYGYGLSSLSSGSINLGFIEPLWPFEEGGW